MMIFHDPPRHEQLRRLVGRAFTPRRVAELDGKIRSMCVDWLDPLVDSGGGEIVADLAGKLPMAVIAALLGAPAEDNHRLKALSDRLLHREDGSMAMPDDGRAAGAELYVYFSELIASRRKRPADDLTTDLTQAEIVGGEGESERLTDDEIVAFCLLLGVAGNETTAKMIATGTVVLAQFPDERSRLVENPALWPNAVEELLRFDPPSHYQGRVTTHPVSRHGEEIPRGRSSFSSTGRPIATTGRSMNRIALSPTAPSSGTWPSATASISALAPRWPGSKRASRSRNWYVGSRSTKSTWRGWSDSTRRTSVGSRKSRSLGDRGRPAADAGSGSRNMPQCVPHYSSSAPAAPVRPAERSPPCFGRSGSVGHRWMRLL